MRAAITLLFCVAFAMLPAACSSCDEGRKTAPRVSPSSSASASSSSANTKTKTLRRKPKTQAELPTTEADIFLSNLDGQIGELTRLVTENPAITNNIQRLGGAHHTRARFRGDVDELQLGIDMINKCIAKEPDNAVCFLMRAEQEQSLHRFKEARADLANAKRIGFIGNGEATRVIDLETELDWNDGLYDKAIPALRKARIDRPSTTTWIRDAQLAHDLGGTADEVDAAFEAAEDLIADTSPFVVAHLNLQRGIEKVSRGALEEAIVFFRAAVERFPAYIGAQEHLGETLHMLGKDDEAIAIYEKIVKESTDPEFMHALAELYESQGKQGKPTKHEEARALATKARTGYEALLKKYPEAMYWHASEFYMAIGEKAKALELLKKNVALRPNSTSYVALANAELANNKAADAKKSIDLALAMPVKSAALFKTAALIYDKSGDATAANGFREKAKSLNPLEK